MMKFSKRIYIDIHSLSLMQEKTAVLIDAAYLSKISKYFGKGKYLKYNVQNLAIKLSQKAGLLCEDIYYYTAPPYQSDPPTPEESKRKSEYDKFIKHLVSKKPTTWIREGRCQRIKVDGKFVYAQKGVDNLLTKDLTQISQRKQFKTIILITADTDFAQIIKEIKEEYGIKIVLGYYTDRKRGSSFSMSNHLWNVCDKKILLDKSYFFI